MPSHPTEKPLNLRDNKESNATGFEETPAVAELPPTSRYAMHYEPRERKSIQRKSYIKVHPHYKLGFKNARLLSSTSRQLNNCMLLLVTKENIGDKRNRSQHAMLHVHEFVLYERTCYVYIYI